MATQLTNYQCPACTGPLHFDGASGKLVCDFCGSSYDTAEIEALYAEKEAAAETCLLYTSDAADERSSVDLGGPRIIKKKKKSKNTATDTLK